MKVDKAKAVLYGKILITGQLECLTGLHIGASKENLEIGALDSPVVRDPISRQPYIPGSSLKGKMRALLERSLPDIHPNRAGGSGTYRHECDFLEHALECPICRLYGSTGGSSTGTNHPSRLRVRDLFLDDGSLIELESIDTGLPYTESKFENTIDRITSAANLRNLERVPRGAKFNIQIVYDVMEIYQYLPDNAKGKEVNPPTRDASKPKEDLQNLRKALRLIEHDALGGHGSRGYGQVKLDEDSGITVQALKLDYFKAEKGERDSFAKTATSLDALPGLVDFLIS